MIQLKVDLAVCVIIWYGALILIQTMLNCIDNSGAAIVECVQVMKMKRAAKIGTGSALLSHHLIHLLIVVSFR